jgi:hypothetical protein
LIFPPSSTAPPRRGFFREIALALIPLFERRELPLLANSERSGFRRTPATSEGPLSTHFRPSRKTPLLSALPRKKRNRSCVSVPRVQGGTCKLVCSASLKACVGGGGRSANALSMGVESTVARDGALWKILTFRGLHTRYSSLPCVECTRDKPFWIPSIRDRLSTWISRDPTSLPPLPGITMDHDDFDCFLSHNGRDKPAARGLAARLRDTGISVWLDEEQLRPGDEWQPGLQTGIRASKSIAVLIGEAGMGPWQDQEVQFALNLAVRDQRPVIPVLLPGVGDTWASPRTSPGASPFAPGSTCARTRTGTTVPHSTGWSGVSPGRSLDSRKTVKPPHCPLLLTATGPGIDSGCSCATCWWPSRPGPS